MALMENPTRCARGAATDILDKCWNGDLPIRPEQIATAMGVRLVARGGVGDEAYSYSKPFT